MFIVHVSLKTYTTVSVELDAEDAIEAGRMAEDFVLENPNFWCPAGEKLDSVIAGVKIVYSGSDVDVADIEVENPEIIL
jgi:hypothetical protein